MNFTETQLERYARHFVLPEIGVTGQKRLLQSKVLVIGAGALGSSALLYLAAAGVGTIGIADYDTVALSNLQRQVIHRVGAIGISKIESARQSILELNPDINIQLHPCKMTTDNIADSIAPYNFIIDGTDRFGSKFLINDCCVLLQKPYSHAGIVRFGGQTMTYVPGQGPCLRCLLGQVPPNTTTCAQAGVLGAATGILGSMQAMEAIKYLLGIGELLTGKILQFDGLHMTFRVTPAVKASPRCSVCGATPSITSLIENREEYEDSSCHL